MFFPLFGHRDTGAPPPARINRPGRLQLTTFEARDVPATIATWDFNTPTPDNDPTTGTYSTKASEGTPVGTAMAVGGVKSKFIDGNAKGGSSDPTAVDDSALYLYDSFPAQNEGDRTAGAELVD